MKNQKKLSELAATAICGNDISSSVLYVSALAIAFAGQYAWITLLMVFDWDRCISSIEWGCTNKFCGSYRIIGENGFGSNFASIFY